MRARTVYNVFLAVVLIVLVVVGHELAYQWGMY